LLLALLLVPESPRWLFTTGKNEKGKTVVKKFARLNKKNIDEDIFVKATVNTEQETNNNNEEETTKVDESFSKKIKKYSTIDLFKTRSIRNMTLNILFQWFTCTIIYYGIALNAEDLTGSIFVNNALYGVTEVFANVFILVLINKIGRKTSLYGGAFIASFGLLSLTLITEFGSSDSETIKTLSIIFAMFGKFGSAICTSSIYTITVELYPTVLRSSGLGLGSASSRVGGTIAPFVLMLKQYIRWLPNVIFIAFGFLTAFSAFYLPETSGEDMQDNIEETKKFLRKERNKNTTNL